MKVYADTQQVRCCARLRIHAGHSIQHRVTVQALRATARRIRLLAAEAAQLLVSWSHPGRVRSEAAFAMLAGVASLEASSGRVTRHRLNRTGDRQRNRALHVVALTRLRQDPATSRSVARRRAQGNSDKEIRRCRKRILARKLFRLMQRRLTPVPTSPA